MISPADRTSLFSEYYFSKKLREIRDLQSQGKPIINLGIGSPDLPPSDLVIEELCRSSALSAIHGYQSYQGLPELQASIKAFYERQYQCTVGHLSVLPSMGSKEIITHISLAYLNPGDSVLIPELGYPTYTSVSRMVGAEPIFYPLIDGIYKPNWEVIETMDLSKVKLMWLNYPHMPTGARGSTELFQQFVDFAHKYDILLCHDNPYSFIGNSDPMTIFSIPGSEDVALELSSVSKTFNMAGWRVGWVLGRESLIQPVLQIKSNMDSGMFYGIQKAASKALELDSDWYDTLNKTYSRRRALGNKIFDQLECEYAGDQVGMFIWAKAPMDGEEFIEMILDKYNVFLAPGFIFGEQGKGFVRMSLCASEEKLEEVINRL